MQYMVCLAESTMYTWKRVYILQSLDVGIYKYKWREKKRDKGDRENMTLALLWLWRLVNPSICRGQAVDSGAPMVSFQSQSEGLRPRRADGVKFQMNVADLRPRKMLQFKLKGRKNCYLNSEVVRQELPLSFFVLIKPAEDSLRSIHIRQDDLLASAYWCRC